MNSRRFIRSPRAVLVLLAILGGAALAIVAQGSREEPPAQTQENDMLRRNRTEIDGIKLTQFEENYRYEIELSEAQWKEVIAGDRYYVLREKGTERPFQNALWDNHERGIYYSAATGQPLFHSDDKYTSGTGWPSFTKPISEDAVHLVGDYSLFMARVEAVDSLSGSHLGHVFSDGPAPTGLRYCMNSAALIFVPEGDPPPVIAGLAEALGAN